MLLYLFLRVNRLNWIKLNISQSNEERERHLNATVADHLVMNGNVNGKKGFWRVCWSHSVCLQGRDIIVLGERSTISKDTVQLLVSAEPAFCARDSGQQGRITGVWFTVWDTLSWILDYTFKQLIHNLNHNSCLFKVKKRQRTELKLCFQKGLYFSHLPPIGWSNC